MATLEAGGQPVRNVVLRVRELECDEADSCLLKEGGRRAQAATDAQGRFRIDVAPGDYDISGASGSSDGSQLQYGGRVEVPAGGYAQVDAKFFRVLVTGQSGRSGQ